MSTKLKKQSIETLCLRSKNASRALMYVSSQQKNDALEKIADQLWLEREEIIASNSVDISAARSAGMNNAMLDRLLLDEKRLAAIVDDLRNVAKLPDPVGEIFEIQEMPNGLSVHKQRVPLGVLGVIYEARPNVTVDVAGLALKSSNCVILRGGSETIQSNVALVSAIQRGLSGTVIPEDAIQLIADTDRRLVHELLQMDRYINMIIPRGGAGLHEFCRQNSRIPVITGGIGICHLYVDESADLERAIEVIRNAKIQRPSVCNALDTCLIHKSVAEQFLPRLVQRLSTDGVTFRAEEKAWAILKELNFTGVQPSGELDFDTEWLSLVLGLKVVYDLKEAIDHISTHSTAHSDGILTENKENAALFLKLVDSAAVYVNASTRFTDGSQLGLGAEMAISTQRLHARGPMGIKELTTYKWIIQGDYNIRP
jgi:glutamate-5-semialdehyde dehydrogenase